MSAKPSPDQKARRGSFRRDGPALAIKLAPRLLQISESLGRYFGVYCILHSTYHPPTRLLSRGRESDAYLTVAPIDFYTGGRFQVTEEWPKRWKTVARATTVFPPNNPSLMLRPFPTEYRRPEERTFSSSCPIIPSANTHLACHPCCQHRNRGLDLALLPAHD